MGKFLGFGFLVFFSITEIFSAPIYQVNHRVVNGYDVYLINMKRGNRVAFSVDIPTGSWMDDPIKHAGRNHLFEHLVFLSAGKYRGKETLELLTLQGAEANAYTADSQVYYHTVVHQDGIEGITDIMGAMITQMDLPEDAFLRERTVVMAEAKDYQDQDHRALESLLFLQLLPEGHPLKMYDIGTQEQLQALTSDDIRSLYYANYGPGSASIIVAANFDQLPEKTVLDQIEKHFKFGKKPKEIADEEPGRKKIFPDIRDPREKNIVPMIEIGNSTGNKILRLSFQIPSKLKDSLKETIETVHDWINSNNTGALRDKLKKSGLSVDGINAYISEANNLGIFTLYLELTDDGAKNKDRVMELILGELGRLGREGISDEALRYLRQYNFHDYSKQFLDPEFTTSIFAKRLRIPGIEPSEQLNLEALYGSVTAENFNKVVQTIFKPENLIVGYCGDDIKSETRDAIFNRPIIVSKDADRYERLNQAVAGNLENPLKVAPQIKPVDESLLKPASNKTDRKGMVSTSSVERHKIVLEEDHTSPFGAIVTNIRLKRLSTEQAVALDLALNYLTELKKDESSALRAIGQSVAINLSNGSIHVKANGNAGFFKNEFAKWIKAIFSLKLDPEEFARVQKEYVKSHEMELQNAFSGQIAAMAALNLLHRDSPNTADKIKFGKSLTVLQVQEIFQNSLERALLTTAFVGDFEESEAFALVKNIIKENKIKELTQRQFDETAQRHFGVNWEEKGDTGLWIPLPENKKDEDLGLAFLLKGPERLSKEHLAAIVLENALSDYVFGWNRTEKGLGYVHNALLRPAGTSTTFALYGGTEGAEKARSMAEGLLVSLHQAARGKLRADGYAGDKLKLDRLENLSDIYPIDRADKLITSMLVTGDPVKMDKFLKGIFQLTEDEIREVAEKYLASRPLVAVVASKTPKDQMHLCGPLLQTIGSVQSRMSPVDSSFKKKGSKT